MNFQKTSTRFIIVILFSITMAYLESAVVVYLRMIYYPEGFQFPLKIIPPATYIIELGREFSTIIMLAAAGYLAGKNLYERFFYFLFCFGVWDIFYYVWLKVFLNWPASIFENDLLFLIPVPWVGPVIAPVIISLTMIAASMPIIILSDKGCSLKTNKIHLLLSASGLSIILTSFLWNAFTTDLQTDPNPVFQWGIFLSGEVMLLAGIFLFIKQTKYNNFYGMIDLQ